MEVGAMLRLDSFLFYFLFPYSGHVKNTIISTWKCVSN